MEKQVRSCLAGTAVASDRRLNGLQGKKNRRRKAVLRRFWFADAVKKNRSALSTREAVQLIGGIGVWQEMRCGGWQWKKWKSDAASLFSVLQANLNGRDDVRRVSGGRS